MYTTHLPRLQKPAKIKVTGKLLTMPNRSINIRKAIQNMAFGSMEDRAGAFYEENGLVIPDFRMMDRIEKLHALSEYREEVQRLVNKANQMEIQQDNYLNHKKLKDEQQKQAAAAAAKSDPKPAGT